MQECHCREINEWRKNKIEELKKHDEDLDKKRIDDEQRLVDKKKKEREDAKNK